MSAGIGQEQRIVVKEGLVMFCTGRVKRRGKGAVCWFFVCLGVFLCFKRNISSLVWCPWEVVFHTGQKKCQRTHRGCFCLIPVCALACWWCAAFLGVTEEETHQSSVAWVLCSAAQVCFLC